MSDDRTTPFGTRPASSRIGGYEVRGLLGAGGMGEVYRAHDTKLGRDVALKLLPEIYTSDPDRLARFEREARVLASLTHPNIAAIYGLEENGGVPVLVLELVEGPTLADRLAKGRLPLREAVDIAAQIAHAIEAAHEQGIVHRDLKPANIKISPSGLVKVLDFGLAKIGGADAQTRAWPATETGGVVGTAAYMSPEQAAGLPVDKRTDVWAFGCVLYEMLTGEPAVSRDEGLSRLPAEVPDGLRRLLRRCLQVDRQQRLRDIGDAWIELNAVADGNAKATMASRAGRRVYAWVALVAFVVAGAVAFGSWAMKHSVADAERVEFAIGPPEGVTWGELPPDPGPRLSPDGQLLAFEGQTSEAHGLWLREVNTLSARLLAGTQDYQQANPLFWAPDSSTIAYCNGKGIKKIDLSGRPPELIDVPCVEDGSWSVRDEILFTAADGLFRVAAKGGSAVRVTTRPPQSPPHYDPRWLPDGRRFMYNVPGGTPVSGIFAGEVGGGPPRRILAEPSTPVYVDGGPRGAYLLFGRVSTLMAQRLDPSLQPVGEPVPLATQIGMGNARRPSVTATSSLLVYRPGTGFGSKSIMWLDRQGRRMAEPAYGRRVPVAQITLSHDGKTIAYTRTNRDTNNLELWTADVVRGTEQPLYVPGPYALATSPVFSPDDRRIAFTEAGSGRVLPRDGGAGPEVLIPLAGFEFGSWAADGKTFVGGGGNVVLTQRLGDKTATLVARPARHAQLSPDGRWLAYTALDSGAPEIVVQAFSDGRQRTRISTAGGFQPRWRADGRELYYLTRDGDLMAVGLRLGASVIAEAPVRLFQEKIETDGANFGRRDYDVSADGQRFVVAVAQDEPKLLTAVRNWMSSLPK